MPTNDRQNRIHNVTVQQFPPSYQSPRKKLSHAVKDVPSSANGGVFVVIPRRVPFLRRRYRKR